MGQQANRLAISPQEHQSLDFSNFFDSSRSLPKQYLPLIEQINILRRLNTKHKDILFKAEAGSLGKGFAAIDWVRVTQIMPEANIYASIMTDWNQEAQVEPINVVLAWLETQDHLIQRIFPKLQILQQGIFIVSLPIKGSHRSMQQVIIDDYIPVKVNSIKYFRPLPASPRLWMVLLEKAAAKFLGSYESLYKLSLGRLFQLFVGVPLGKLGEKLDLKMSDIGKAAYDERFFISSSQCLANPEQSLYFKIQLDGDMQISLTLWEVPADSAQKSFSVLMVELIKLKKDAGQLKFERRLKINQIFNDKEGTTLLVDSLNNRFMALETGTYMLHIFNRNPSQSALINVIANSSRPINLRFRREKQFDSIKEGMQEELYFLSHPVDSVGEGPGIESKFKQDGIRCLLLLKRTHKDCPKMFKIVIRESHRDKIFFQYHREAQYLSISLKLYESMIVKFIKRRDEQIGPFYEFKFSH